jgi:flagellar basal body rod protein FlgF
MDKALYISMTGASQTMRAQAVHANNLANASTTGFQADLAQARAMAVYGEGMPSRVFSMTENPGTDFSEASCNRPVMISIWPSVVKVTLPCRHQTGQKPTPAPAIWS